jgi:phospholipid/cholesterol/gamma-HCH transport system substrate-binding protein
MSKKASSNQALKKPSFWSRHSRPLAGVLTVLALTLVFAVAVGLFQGRFTTTVPVTVVADRAGLVMYPDAKVKLNGAPVGKVASIEPLPDGGAALHLAIDPASIEAIPSNVGAEITSSTVFGSKFVELIPPSQPSPDALQAGTTIRGGDKVTVEINTVFEKLVGVLAEVEPAKLNQTLGAISTSLNGRGEEFGKALVDLDSALAKLNPSLDNLNQVLEISPTVFNSLADSSTDLLTTIDNVTRISDTVVDQRDGLDALLLSAIGLADIGTDVLSENRRPLADVIHLLVPTTDLTNQYHPALYCGVAGLLPLANGPGLAMPGATLLQGFFLGRERYRYPGNLPKVAATGGPQCTDLPNVAYEQRPPYVVTDIGANQAQYGNQGILLNSDALKQALFGPLDGPPRNTAQIGMPG